MNPIFETVRIEGRNRWSGTAVTTVTVRDKYRNALLVIEGGYIESRGAGEFLLAAKHPSATDSEHDSAFVAYLEGAGLVWKDMYGPVQKFTGVLLKAQFYPAPPEPKDVGKCDRCDTGHGFLRFTPHSQKWDPANYEIEVEHHA